MLWDIVRVKILELPAFPILHVHAWVYSIDRNQDHGYISACIVYLQCFLTDIPSEGLTVGFC